MNPTDPYVARLIEVARAYYLDNRTQAEIARGLGISRSMVSRYLTSARALGIVQIKIAGADALPERQGASLIRQYSHLHDVMVAPTFSSEPDAQRAMIGRFAANYLMDMIRPNQTISLGCGRTLLAMVDALQKSESNGMVVVQAMGNIGHEAYKIDYNEIARRAAEALGGSVYYISAPAILGVGSGKANDFVAANRTLLDSLSLARRADIYIVGLGSLESDQLYARVGLVQQDELDDLKRRSAVGDICGRFFNLDGNELASVFDDRVVGIQLDDLRKAKLAIGAAAGPDKVAPLLGAIRGGFLNVIITDETTLEAVIKLDGSDK
jgi:deoxyribonucleoside regulator